MKTKYIFQKFIFTLGQVMSGAALLLFTRNAEANPTGVTVQSGTATFSVNGSQFTVNVGNNAQLNWQSFNIGAGEKTIFNQPSASSIVWNRIDDPHPSQIYGSLQANGVVVLLNSSGFYFGPNSYVSAAGLVVSTANCMPPQNAGGAWVFNGPPPLASIINYGQIKIGNGGDCFFIADKTENHGSVEAPDGNISFAAGQTVTLSERPDGRGMSMQVKLPQGSVDNYGNVVADGGTIALNAKVVNQNGFLQANSVQNNNGIIELVASDALNLGADSKISANGDDSIGGSAGGKITLKSAKVFNDIQGSEISIAGGAHGGNGGNVEISAPVMPAVNSKIDGHAQAGSTGGKLLLDPDFIVLDQSGSDAPTVNGSSGTVLADDAPGATLHFNVNSAFSGLSDITLQAKYDISIADGTTWNLSDSTGQSDGQLTLEAGRNIIFGNTTLLTDNNHWSVSLYAGVTDFAQKIVSPGAGSIYFNAVDPNNPGDTSDPSGSIMLSAGSANLVAGQDIIVGTGRVITTGGGSISAHALAGNIDTGGFAQGYLFQSADTAAGGYFVDSSLFVGGISTTAGGDVTLIAGGNVQSILPGRNGYFYDGNFFSAIGSPDVETAGAGAYGFGDGQAGDVKIVAGGDVTGHYVVGNGTGKIFAGVQMDANGNPIPDGADKYVLGTTGNAGTDQSQPNLALSLVKGGWNVTAAQNIILQEVRNPNGDFNTVDKRSKSFHNFDYDAADYVNLDAGNLVQLGGAASLLPRLNTDGLKVPVIYPGILNIMAGAGGVVLTGDSTYNQLILFPSPLGSLTIKTTDGGPLTSSLPAVSGTPQIFNLIMSDSGRTQYNPSSALNNFFGLADHAATPVHLGSETPFSLDISGDMDSVLISAPEAAQITVHGDMNNSRFQGMNLSANDASFIHVTGDINNRGAFTTLDLSTVANSGVPDLSLIGQAIMAQGDPSVATLLSAFFYNPATHILTYQNIPNLNIPLGNFPPGISDPVAYILYRLQHLTIQVYVNGIPQWQDPPFNTIPKTTEVSVLDSASADALLAKFNTLGPAPSGAFGYAIGGGGSFEMSAHDMDLGTTAGIKSVGVGLYNNSGIYPLAKLFNAGADLKIDLTGSLNMFSAAIASQNGGDIEINAAGDLNVGSPDFSVTSLAARGIFTTGQGNLRVIAGGDINVNGSRIAAYDGGNVMVESLFGDVNAGTGGSGFVVVNSFTVDPLTHAVKADAPTIPGSGILATTFPDDLNAKVGNILVETPNGNINASSGGIVQLPLNGVNSPDPVVAVLAGYEMRDNNNDPVDAAHIAGGTPTVAFSDQNLVTFGSRIQVLPAGQLIPIQLIPVLDTLGHPRLDANNHLLYVQEGDATQQVVTYVAQKITPFLAAGINVNIAKLKDEHGVDQTVLGRNINASGSGVIAQNALLDATGNIQGVIFSKFNIVLNTPGQIAVTALGQQITANAGGFGPGELIGQKVDAANADPSQILSQDANGKGSSFTAGTTANATSQAASSDNATALTDKKADDETDQLSKKKGIALAQKVSRVTVILPKKD